MKTIVLGAACALLVLALSGCATIVSGGDQKVDFQSDPSEASIKVYDSSGMVVASSQTPTSLLLKKGAGYFKGASYRVVVEKPGYKRTEVLLQSSLNAGWYIAGNLFIGGLIGWLIVDPMSGAMWTLSPERVSTELSAEVSSMHPGKELKIVLLADVPREVRSLMAPVAIRTSR